MKIVSASILGLTVLIVTAGCRNHDIHAEVTETPQTLRVVAEFPDDKNEAVREYVNDAIRPTVLFASHEDQFDREITLNDGTNFRAVSDPGSLKITLDRTKNSTASYHLIKDLGHGLAKALQRQ